MRSGEPDQQGKNFAIKHQHVDRLMEGIFLMRRGLLNYIFLISWMLVLTGCPVIEIDEELGQNGGVDVVPQPDDNDAREDGICNSHNNEGCDDVYPNCFDDFDCQNDEICSIINSECQDTSTDDSTNTDIGNNTVIGIDNYYLPPELSFISWDYPVVMHTGLDVDYKMTGYDWFNRNFTWSVANGPDGMSIEDDGTLHWTPAQEGMYDVTVQLQIGNEEILTKDFTISVDNSRSIFISPDGNNETGTGTIDNPYAYFGETVAKKIVELEGKVTVYHRGGTYQNLELAWYENATPYMRRLNILEPDTNSAVIIRNYPGEHPVLELAREGFRVHQPHWIFYGMELSGGSGSEGAALVVFKQSVAKRMQVHDYDHAYLYNPTGILTAGNVILDQVVAWDNYDRNNTDHHNSSNFLFYGEKVDTDEHAFFIDCLSLSYSASGFKVKHAGDETILHIHKSADIGTRRPIAMAQNHNSVRYSYFYSEYYENPVMNLDATDPVTDDHNSETDDRHADEGMLFQHNLVVEANTNGRALFHAQWLLNTTPDNPVIWDNNTIESHSLIQGNIFASGLYNDVYYSWNMQFSNNKLYSASPENAVLISKTGYPLSKLSEFGDNNQILDNHGTYIFTVAGRTFRISNASVEEITE